MLLLVTLPGDFTGKDGLIERKKSGRQVVEEEVNQENPSHGKNSLVAMSHQRQRHYPAGEYFGDQERDTAI